MYKNINRFVRMHVRKMLLGDLESLSKLMSLTSEDKENRGSCQHYRGNFQIYHELKTLIKLLINITIK